MINKEQFQKYFIEHYPGVKSYFLHKGFPQDKAEDLTQDVFLRVYEYRASFQGRSSFRSWLNTIMANVWKNWIRNKRALKNDAPVVSIDSNALESDKLGQSEMTSHPLKEMVEKQNRELLRKAVMQLPIKIRTCLMLRVYEELSYKDIANLLEIKKDTVKSRLHQAQVSLKQILDKHIHIDFMDR